MPAPVHRVTRLGHFSAERLLFTFANRQDAISADTKAAEVVLHRGGTALTKRQVVLVGAARIA
jgi:hypothetical protein